MCALYCVFYAISYYFYCVCAQKLLFLFAGNLFEMIFAQQIRNKKNFLLFLCWLCCVHIEIRFLPPSILAAIKKIAIKKALATKNGEYVTKKFIFFIFLCFIFHIIIEKH